MEHRLAAIVAADMVGYSRLMEMDERGTLARLRTHRIELIDPVIEKNNGRIIKTTGDGLLVEFHSVADAMRAAIEIQDRMRRRNSDVPADRRIEFRIGINLGDIIFEDGDVYGDGVNIAARVEQLAEVGGICVTAAVHNQVDGRVEATFDDLGEKPLKNISRPVRVYRVLIQADGRDAGQAEGARGVNKAAVVKPSIAVLPFANMSGDPEQEFFADGLTEDILTELSRRHELFVISRTSSFVYKGQAANLREVAQKLGARYLVEGSVRKAGERLRITVQLIDTATDGHIWAERYDRKLDDIFAVQDEITIAIVATLPGRLEAAQHNQLSRLKPSSMAAYECALAAKVLHHKATREDNAEALKLIDRALSLDPDYAHAHAWRGCILGQAWGYGWVADKDTVFNEVTFELDRAITLDDNDADVHRILAAIAIVRNDMTRARHHQDRALALNPNYDLVVVQMGELFTWLGQAAEGVDWIRRAMKLNPHHPPRFWGHLGRAHFVGREYAKAIEAFMHMTNHDAQLHGFLAAAYAYLGDGTAAAAHIGRLRELDRALDLEKLLATMHYARQEDLLHLRDGLRKAGY
ncbi:MAG: adenylate/guanylate cyclase domain-containing protein [Rhodospirillales bacterium]|nr:adenylate/guanylate cyclase domain-containing protein [Rhodospirillales bacterium]